jgi:hypothetical protein
MIHMEIGEGNGKEMLIRVDFPSLINPINTNVDKIFHFVFIQTGPVQF